LRSSVADVLADLAVVFAALEVEWYLFGAQAAIVYGVARLTGDVDVTVRVPDRLPMAAVAGELERCGFRPRISDPAFIDQSRILPFVHEATGLPVDMVLAGPGIEDEFIARAQRRPIDGVEVPVADVTDLIVMKVLAGRPKDIEDVVKLLRVQEGRVSLARARNILAMFEEALAQDDLLPALDQAVARANRKGR